MVRELRTQPEHVHVHDLDDLDNLGMFDAELGRAERVPSELSAATENDRADSKACASAPACNAKVRIPSLVEVGVGGSTLGPGVSRAFTGRDPDDAMKH